MFPSLNSSQDHRELKLIDLIGRHKIFQWGIRNSNSFLYKKLIRSRIMIYLSKILSDINNLLHKECIVRHLNLSSNQEDIGQARQFLAEGNKIQRGKSCMMFSCRKDCIGQLNMLQCLLK